MDWNKPFMVNNQMKDFFHTIAWKYVSLYDVQMLTYGRWYMQSRCCRLQNDKIVLKMLNSLELTEVKHNLWAHKKYRLQNLAISLAILFFFQTSPSSLFTLIDEDAS